MVSRGDVLLEFVEFLDCVVEFLNYQSFDVPFMYSNPGAFCQK